MLAAELCMANLLMAKMQGGLYVGRNWNATKNLVLTSRRGACLAQGHTSQYWALPRRLADSLSRLLSALVSRLREGDGVAGGLCGDRRMW